MKIVVVPIYQLILLWKLSLTIHGLKKDEPKISHGIPQESKRSLQPQSMTRCGRSTDSNPPTTPWTRHGKSLRPQSVTRFGRSADTKPIRGGNNYISSIIPQSIARFGGFADKNPISQWKRHGRSIRPQSVTKWTIS